jgi:hypothetical protein
MKSNVSGLAIKSLASIAGWRLMVSTLVLSLIIGCTGAGNTDDVNSASSGSNTSKKLSHNTKPISLLESLQALYPSGGMTAEQEQQSIKALSQNPAVLRMTSSTVSMQSTSVITSQAAVTSNFMPVKRVQNTELTGAYFFTIYPDELTTALCFYSGWHRLVTCMAF